MKYIKTLISASALAVASSNVSAAPVTVGGITWDNVDEGILSNFAFTQWYSPTDVSFDLNGNPIINNPYGTGSSGQSTIIDNSAVTFSTPFAMLTGVGIFTNFNDGKGLFPGFDYCADGPSCSLTFAFGGLIATAQTGDPIPFDTTNAWLNIYFQSTNDGNYDQTNVGLLFNNNSKASNNSVINYAQSGSLWASFKFDTAVLNPDQLNSLQGGSLEGLLSVVPTIGLSDVVAKLDKHSGMSDFYIDGAASFPSDSLYAKGVGEAQIVPAPLSIALLGIGLVVLAGIRRQNQR